MDRNMSITTYGRNFLNPLKWLSVCWDATVDGSRVHMLLKDAVKKMNRNHKQKERHDQRDRNLWLFVPNGMLTSIKTRSHGYLTFVFIFIMHQSLPPLDPFSRVSSSYAMRVSLKSHCLVKTRNPKRCSRFFFWLALRIGSRESCMRVLSVNQSETIS